MSLFTRESGGKKEKWDEIEVVAPLNFLEVILARWGGTQNSGDGCKNNGFPIIDDLKQTLNIWNTEL